MKISHIQRNVQLINWISSIIELRIHFFHWMLSISRRYRSNASWCHFQKLKNIWPFRSQKLWEKSNAEFEGMFNPTQKAYLQIPCHSFSIDWKISFKMWNFRRFLRGKRAITPSICRLYPLFWYQYTAMHISFKNAEELMRISFLIRWHSK